MIEQLSERLFSYIHSNFLIYNICWEDPEIDRELLHLSNEDDVLMITSAGCNALTYLIDNPSSITCVDMNPFQNALLELKIAAFKATDHNTVFMLFGKGRHPNIKDLYYSTLRKHLSISAATIWDHHLYYFEPGNGLYWNGTSGWFARLMQYYFQLHPDLHAAIKSMFKVDNLNDQIQLFNQIRTKLWTSFSRWLMNQDAAHALLGVPRVQKQMIQRKYDDQVSDFIDQCFQNVFKNLPAWDNYFWRVYVFGEFTRTCCPSYLKAEYFDNIQQRIERISIQTGTLTEALNISDKTFSACILLDHQDWMYEHNQMALEDEWNQLLKLPPGSRYLLRSAGHDRSFIPSFVDEHMIWYDNITTRYHQFDRVGTYGSTHLGGRKA